MTKVYIKKISKRIPKKYQKKYQERVKNKYRSLSEDEKNIKRQYKKNRCHNMSDEKKKQR